MDENETGTFWVGFFLGWAFYFAITVFFGFVESGLLGRSLQLATLNFPLVLTSSVVAANRRRLFRPEWGALQTGGVHLAVGFAFAVVTALLLFGAMEVTDFQSGEWGTEGPWIRFLFVLLQSVFLYVVFAGVLMWSESIRRMRESHRATAREAVLRAEAEAKAVRAQFNPHFVFNTLHSLMLLVRADPAAAERAIEDVATLIRYATILQRRDIDAVSLEKELQVARRYVALEELRLDERLRVEWAVDVDPERVTIPAFALQTLVENAIKHGIEPVAAGGRVDVSASLERDMLLLRVRDDGVGAQSGEVLADPGRGLGLLQQRLASRYGNSGSLEWKTARGAGFEATVRVPVEAPPSAPELDVIEGRATPSIALPT